MRTKEASETVDRINSMNARCNDGFTFIEIVLVIGITLLIVAAASPLYTGLQVSSQLNESVTSVVQATRMAREWSVARLNDAPHGIFFEVNAGDNDRYILYQGPTYVTRDSSYDRIMVLDNGLSLSTTLFNDEVNFSRGLGIPNTTGVITLTHDVSGTRTITLNGEGKVEEQ